MKMKRIEFVPKKVEFIPDPIMDVKKPRTDKLPTEKRKEIQAKIKLDYSKKSEEARKPVVKTVPAPAPEKQTFTVIESRTASDKEVEEQKAQQRRPRVEVQEPEVVTQEQSSSPEPRVIVEPKLPFNRLPQQPKGRTIEIEQLPNPGDPIDWQNVSSMLSYGCDESEVAGFYCISIIDLKERCLSEQKKSWDVFSEQCYAILRRNLKQMQYRKAMGHMRKGTNGKEYFIPSDPIMLIHLGKHILGQNDKLSLKDVFTDYVIEDHRNGKGQITHESVPNNIIDGVAVIDLDNEED